MYYSNGISHHSLSSNILMGDRLLADGTLCATPPVRPHIGSHVYHSHSDLIWNNEDKKNTNSNNGNISSLLNNK